VVVVEGYVDAISVYQAGMKNVVASMGTAFTEDQVGALWRLSSSPIICFDSDRAGIAAAHRSIDRILPLLQVGRSFKFAFMRDEKDPDDFVREKGLDEFKTILRGALPLWDVLWEREIAVGDANTPDGIAALEAKLNQIIRTIKDSFQSSFGKHVSIIRCLKKELFALSCRLIKRGGGTDFKKCFLGCLCIILSFWRNALIRLLISTSLLD
jgi:DNA primase catalytic core